MNRWKTSYASTRCKRSQAALFRGMSDEETGARAGHFSLDGDSLLGVLARLALQGNPG
jgi:hypothetical protein